MSDSNVRYSGDMKPGAVEEWYEVYVQWRNGQGGRRQFKDPALAKAEKNALVRLGYDKPPESYPVIFKCRKERVE